METIETGPTESNASPAPLHWGDLLTINLLFGGTSFLWGALPSNILAPIVLILVPKQGADASLAFLLILGHLISMLTQPFGGALSDRLRHRWGRRRPLMVAGTITSLVFLGLLAWTLTGPLTNAGTKFSFLPFTDNADYWLIVLWYVGLQFGSNLAQASAQGLIPDLAPSSQRGAAAGVKTFFELLVGFVLIAIFVPAIYSNSGNLIVLGGQNLILIIAVVLLLTLVLNVVAIREVPASSNHVPPVIETARHAFEMNPTRDAAYINLLALRLFCLAGFAIFLNFSGFYFRDLVLANQPNASEFAGVIQRTLLFIIGVSAVVISIPAGVISDHFGRRPVTAIGGLLAAVGAFGILLVRNVIILNLGLVAITDLGLVGILIGLGMGLFHAGSWAWATDLVPPDQAARFLGLAYVATIGSLLLAYLGGLILDAFNTFQPGSGFNLVFVLAAVWLGLGALISLRTRDTRGKNAGATPIMSGTLDQV
jgi:MFS family permease